MSKGLVQNCKFNFNNTNFQAAQSNIDGVLSASRFCEELSDLLEKYGINKIECTDKTTIEFNKNNNEILLENINIS